MKHCVKAFRHGLETKGYEIVFTASAIKPSKNLFGNKGKRKIQMHQHIREVTNKDTAAMSTNIMAD